MQGFAFTSDHSLNQCNENPYSPQKIFLQA